MNQNSSSAPEADNNLCFSSCCLAKTPAVCDGWGPCFWMLSPLQSGVTGIFDPLLFVSTLIFIRGKKKPVWQLCANIHFVFSSYVSVLSSGGFISVECFVPRFFQAWGEMLAAFSSVDEIMAALQPPPPLHHSHFILLTQDKAQTNVTQLSGSLSLGAFIYLSGCSGVLSCRLPLTDSWSLAEDAAPTVS